MNTFPAESGERKGRVIIGGPFLRWERRTFFIEAMSTAEQALAELENFGYSTNKAPPPAQDEAPPPKRQRAPARSSEALLAEAEADLESSQVEVAQIDENSMKRMVLSIEKRINENMQLRTKYSDQPERFMDSELELYQELKRLHGLFTIVCATLGRFSARRDNQPDVGHTGSGGGLGSKLRARR